VSGKSGGLRALEEQSGVGEHECDIVGLLEALPGGFCARFVLAIHWQRVELVQHAVFQEMCQTTLIHFAHFPLHEAESFITAVKDVWPTV
jgi:hypothetical protein